VTPRSTSTTTGSQADDPRLSVIICTRDRPDLFPRAMQSVLSEVTCADEVLIVDDGSNPAVSVDLTGPGVKIVRIDSGSVGAARSAGLDAARGRFVAWCDDD